MPVPFYCQRTLYFCVLIKMMLIAGAGGFAGTCGRFLVNRWCATMFHGPFPLGTFLVNMIGCFLFGLIFGLLERANLLTSGENVLLLAGFCGGFTTFSAFANDMLVLGDKGQWLTFGLYLLASIAAGLLLVWAGRAMVR